MIVKINTAPWFAKLSEEICKAMAEAIQAGMPAELAEALGVQLLQGALKLAVEIRVEDI